MTANDNYVIEYWTSIINYDSIYNNGNNEVVITKSNSYTYQSIPLPEDYLFLYYL